jgi:DNA-directed RNA polymerase subunit K/omega
MSDIKNKVQGLDPNVRARNLDEMASQTGNIYEALAVINKRARQLNVDIRRELHNKLEEFATSSEAIEEISENKEQIEISKFYERLPNPVLIAMEEYLNEEIVYRFVERKSKTDKSI